STRRRRRTRRPSGSAPVRRRASGRTPRPAGDARRAGRWARRRPPRWSAWGRSLASLGGAVPKLGLDEPVDVAVEHALGIADLLARPMVLDHLIRGQHVGAD